MSFDEKARTNEFEEFLKYTMADFDENAMDKHFSNLFDEALEDRKYEELEKCFRDLTSTYLPELDFDGLSNEFGNAAKNLEGYILDYKSYDAGMYQLKGINMSHYWSPPDCVDIQILMCTVYDNGIRDFLLQYDSAQLTSLGRYGFPEYNEDWSYWLACKYLQVFLFKGYAQLLKRHGLDYLPFSISLTDGIFEAELSPPEDMDEIKVRTLGNIYKKIQDNELELQDEVERRRNELLPVTDEEFVEIPSGTFLMGSPLGEEGRNDWERLHTVYIESFELMRMPVTYAQYYIYKVTKGSKPPVDIGLLKGTYPIVNISYWDAVGFVDWLTENGNYIYRLPTEAEWEYACRAGTTSTFWYGQEPDEHYMRYELNIRSDDISKVGQLESNPFGLFDMHGNLNEWCSSEWDEKYGGKETRDHSKEKTNLNPRVIRGGCYYYTGQYCRSAWRNRATPNNGRCDVGFRVARTKKV